MYFMSEIILIEGNLPRTLIFIMKISNFYNEIRFLSNRRKSNYEKIIHLQTFYHSKMSDPKLSCKNQFSDTNKLIALIFLCMFGAMNWSVYDLHTGERKLMILNKNDHPQSSLPGTFFLRYL